MFLFFNEKLSKVSIVPVDTHVWQIAKEKYKLKGTEDNKSLTPKVYKHVSQQLSVRKFFVCVSSILKLCCFCKGHLGSVCGMGAQS